RSACSRSSCVASRSSACARCPPRSPARVIPTASRGKMRGCSASASASCAPPRTRSRTAASAAATSCRAATRVTAASARSSGKPAPSSVARYRTASVTSCRRGRSPPRPRAARGSAGRTSSGYSPRAASDRSSAAWDAACSTPCRVAPSAVATRYANAGLTSLPRQHVRAPALATRRAVPTVAEQLVLEAPAVLRQPVDVRPAPRVERHLLAQVRPAPVARQRLGDRLATQRLEPLLLRRVRVVVQAVRVQRRDQQLDLRPRRRRLRRAHVLEDVRRDQRREHTQHHDHDEQLDQREAGARLDSSHWLPPSRSSGSPARSPWARAGAGAGARVGPRPVPVPVISPAPIPCPAFNSRAWIRGGRTGTGPGAGTVTWTRMPPPAFPHPFPHPGGGGIWGGLPGGRAWWRGLPHPHPHPG